MKRKREVARKKMGGCVKDGHVTWTRQATATQTPLPLHVSSSLTLTCVEEESVSLVRAT